MGITFFKSPEEFRKWLKKNHTKASELFVGFYKKNSGKPSMTWPESVDVALCFGWIDAVRKNIDHESYVIRFTKRKPGSIWSNININRVAELTQLGLMMPAGLEAYKHRREKKSGIYSYEQDIAAELDKTFEKKFKANKKAWKFFETQAPWYQRNCIHWIMRAKQQATKEKRLALLIKDSEQEKRLDQYSYNKKK